MTESPTHVPVAPDGGALAVETAETAWLEAFQDIGTDAMRRLMHPDCVVVHAPVGRIDGVDAFLQHTVGMGRISGVRTYDITVRHFDRMAIVSCLQEMRVALAPDRTPFVIQAVATRMWLAGESGWKLVHMQMARRQPPG